MSRKLTPSQFEAARRMLRAGLRQVEVARELDLSVWTVSRIADDCQVRRDADADDDPTADDLPEDDSPPDYVAKNLRRCPGCGAVVYLWPCLACDLRLVLRAEQRAERRAKAPQTPS